MGPDSCKPAIYLDVVFVTASKEKKNIYFIAKAQKAQGFRDKLNI